MDPHTGKIYSPQEIPSLPDDVQKRLIEGELEELQAMSALLTETKAMNETPSAPKNEVFRPINRKAKRAQFKKQGGFKRG
jgi:hypothetical protein